MKTLALILHYNTKEMTDSLYESLITNDKSLYDIFVLDNGSDIKEKSNYPSLSTKENLFFGGGLNWAFDYILKNNQYDSLLFLNSDLIIEKKDFVKNLRNEMFENNLKIISPSIAKEKGNPGCKWQQMCNWGTGGVRTVEWVDFQCPLFHIDFIDHVRYFDEDLKYGWGQEIFSGIICKKNKWEIGVSDNLDIEHLDSVTEKKFNKGFGRIKKLQFKGMNDFFQKENLVEELEEFRNRARIYSI